MPLAVAEPADPRRQALEGDPLAGHADPAPRALVVGELLEHGAVGGGDVRRVAGERDPAERALALAEQRTDVGGDEARVVEGALEPAELGLGAEAVAVVEDLGAASRKPTIAAQWAAHRGAGAADVLVGVAPRAARRASASEIRFGT